jgi:hypothetical protein
LILFWWRQGKCDHFPGCAKRHDRPCRAGENNTHIWIIPRGLFFRIPPLRYHFGPALSGKIKVHFFVSLAVQFQYFRGREPDLFHEQVKRAVLKREGYVVVLRYPNTRVIVPNKQNFIFVHGYISCMVKYRAYPASFQWPFQGFFSPVQAERSGSLGHSPG